MFDYVMLYFKDGSGGYFVPVALGLEIYKDNPELFEELDV